jgi:hypothetical protein
MKHIQSRAKSHMAQARLYGWHERHLIVDYAVAALAAEGYDEDNASAAVEAEWARANK